MSCDFSARSETRWIPKSWRFQDVPSTWIGQTWPDTKVAEWAPSVRTWILSLAFVRMVRFRTGTMQDAVTSSLFFSDILFGSLFLFLLLLLLLIVMLFITVVVVLVFFLMLLLLLVESFRSSPLFYTVGFPIKQDIIRFRGPFPGMALRSLHASVLYIAVVSRVFTDVFNDFLYLAFEVNQKGVYSGRQEGSGPRCPAQRHPRMDIKCWVKP